MTQPETVGLSSERLARITPALAQHLGKGKLAGAVTLVARHGQIAHIGCIGEQDRASGRPMRPDSIFRIYSMTKPITCAALMSLWEEGRVRLIDPVSRFVPAFANLKVLVETGDGKERLEPLERPVTVLDLLNHRSGLTYHFTEYGRVEALYREAGVSSEAPLADFVADLAALPLAFQPGTSWRYSYAHDVAAHLVQVISGQPYDEFLKERIFDPLGMGDTAFFVPADKLERFTAMYGGGDILEPTITGSTLWANADGGCTGLVAGPQDALQSSPHRVLRGGHGLVSTAPDYFRFAQMLLNGGELDGARILGRKTIELMAANHVPPHLLPFEINQVYRPGIGYGLGLGVTMDVGLTGAPGSAGAFFWGGAATTSFWVDPVEKMIGVQMAQFQPNNYFMIEADFRALAYQAIID